MLALCEVQEGNDSRLLVVGRVFSKNGFNAFVVFFGEIKVCLDSVVWSVNVLVYLFEERFLTWF